MTENEGTKKFYYVKNSSYFGEHIVNAEQFFSLHSLMSVHCNKLTVYRIPSWSTF